MQHRYSRALICVDKLSPSLRIVCSIQNVLTKFRLGDNLSIQVHVCSLDHACTVSSASSGI